MTGLDHESSAAIDEAARWYASNRWWCERPVVPALHRRFGVNAFEACCALSQANRLLSARYAKALPRQ